MYNKKLDDISIISDSLHQTPSYVDEGIPMVRVTDVKTGYLSLKKCLKVSEEDYYKFTKKHIPQRGDIVISRVGTYGQFSFALTEERFCLGQNTAIISPLINPEYLYYYLTSALAKQQIESMVVGSTQKTISLKNIKNITVPIFDEVNQKRIGDLLSCIDKKISNNNAINQNLAEQAEALFKERFLSYEDHPLGWKKMTLGDISDMGAGGDKPKIISDQKTETFQYPIYSNGISDEGLYGFTSDYKISSESVTVSARGTIGFVCLRHIPYTPIVRLVTLVPHTDVVSAKYLYLWLKSIPIHGTGTTQQQLTVPDFRKTEIVIPTEAEMREFTETVDPLFQQIWANQKENSSLADIRDTLLPRLMSGEIDVSKLVD